MPGHHRLAVAALCGLLACARRSRPPVPTADEMREIERDTHLAFPASTRVIMWDAGRGIDAYLQMKFEIAASDWPGFLASSPFRDHPLREGGWADLLPDHGAWDPDKVAHLVKGDVQLPNVRSLNLGADMSWPNVVVVYLFWFAT